MGINVVPAGYMRHPVTRRRGDPLKTTEEVLLAWEANCDFLIQDISCRYDGRYMNRQDAETGKEIEIRVRYNSLLDVCFLLYREGRWVVEGDDSL